MVKPNFIVIGTQKGGTSWLRSMLRQHPDVFFAKPEIHYFDNPENYARGSAWYLSHFKEAGLATAIGEKSPAYMLLNLDDPLDIPRKIHDFVPDVKLIVLLRNPVERAISGINHDILRGRLPLDFDFAAAIPQFIEENAPYIRFGFYHDCLSAYHQFFDPAQMLVLIYEENIVDQPAATLRTICRFLGVDESFTFADTQRRVNAQRMSARGVYFVNQVLGRNPFALRLVSKLEKQFGLADHKKRPDSATLDLLYDLYAEPNARLFNMLGREIPGWTKANAYITE